MCAPSAPLKGSCLESFAFYVTPFAQILDEHMRRQTPAPRCAPFEDAIAAFESDVARAGLPETLRAGGIAQPGWSVELGVEYPCTLHELKRAFRGAALRTHPDCGGSHEAFLRTQVVFEEARRELTMPLRSATRHVSPYAGKRTIVQTRMVCAYA